MPKYIVETFYTCTYKIVHKLDELNQKQLSDLENRNDGEFELIDVKLNKRKTRTVNKKFKSDESLVKLDKKNIPEISTLTNEKLVNSKNISFTEVPITMNYPKSGKYSKIRPFIDWYSIIRAYFLSFFDGNKFK